MTLEQVQRLIDTITAEDAKNMIRFICRYTGSYDAACDCYYHAILEAEEQADKIQDPDKISSWLLTVAKRYAIKSSSERKKLVRIYQDIISMECSDEIELCMLHTVLMDACKKVLLKFPPHYSEIIRLRYEDNASFWQIARHLGISYSAARKAHQRIIEQLRNELDIDRLANHMK